MSVYCYWVTVKELDNGDAEILRLANDGGVESRVVVPVQERMTVARDLMRNDDAQRRDVWNLEQDGESVIAPSDRDR